MTKNQLEYWRNQETERSNRANERQASRNQRWKELVDWRTLQEQRRTNIANEGIKERSQVATSQHYERQDAETNRSNLASEALRAESNELSRQNTILGYHQAAVSRENSIRSAAASNYASNLNAQVGMANVAESQRSNIARETENQRSNIANEYLTSLQRGAQGRDVAVRENQLEFEKSKWNDSVVTAQRRADLANTQMKTLDTKNNIIDRRVNTITQGVRNLSSVFGDIARSGRNFITLGGS